MREIDDNLEATAIAVEPSKMIVPSLPGPEQFGWVDYVGNAVPSHR